MSKKIANLQIGEYKLTLEISRTILMDAFNKYPEISQNVANGDTISITKAYEFCKVALLCMVKACDDKFSKEKVEEIFEYADNCVVSDTNEKGEEIETVATDYLVRQIMELINLGFTKQDNAKKIKITLS